MRRGVVLAEKCLKRVLFGEHGGDFKISVPSGCFQ